MLSLNPFVGVSTLDCSDCLIVQKWRFSQLQVCREFKVPAINLFYFYFVITLHRIVFQNVSRVPYFARFHVYARRHQIPAVFTASASNPKTSPLCATPTSAVSTPSSSTSSGKAVPTNNHHRSALFHPIRFAPAPDSSIEYS